MLAGTGLYAIMGKAEKGQRPSEVEAFAVSILARRFSAAKGRWMNCLDARPRTLSRRPPLICSQDIRRCGRIRHLFGHSQEALPLREAGRRCLQFISKLDDADINTAFD